VKKPTNFESIGLYIHYPFCVRKCIYCDFASFTLDRVAESKYFSYLKKEVDLFLDKFPDIVKFSLETLYIGGGTPSLVSVDEFVDFIHFLKDRFDFSKLKEFTIEGNPESISKDKFLVFKELGVNRVSIGAQSFNDVTLKLLGRVHEAKTIEEKFHLLRVLGFSNINIDLMFALPNEDFEMQTYSIKKAIALNPEHISFYSLMLERGTPLYRARHYYNFVDDSVWLKEYFLGKKIFTQNGFVHYEISNFAKPGFFSLHNLKYWESFPYIGFGVSAGSFLNNRRSVNVMNLKSYFAKLDKGELPISFTKRLNGKALKSDYLFMKFRLLEGVSLTDYYKKFGSFLESDFAVELEKLKKSKLIKQTKNKLTLTALGLRFVNVVLKEFI